MRYHVRLGPFIRRRRLEERASDSGMLIETNQLMLKHRNEEGKWIQEYRATQLARIILPSDLAPPQMWGEIDGFFVSESIVAPPLDSSNLEQCIEAARYIARVHGEHLDEAARQALWEAGLRHYTGDALASRIREEGEKGGRAFPDSRETNLLQKIVQEAGYEVHDWDDPVLGHGDFQAANIFVLEGGRICAIDWTDFGLCARAYEVAHFLNSVAAENRASALDAYVSQAGGGLDRDPLVQTGDVLDGIIRAGSAARQVCDNGAPRERYVVPYTRQVNRALDAFRSMGIDLSA